MWIVKIKLRHDCIIGNRCKKFNITIQSVGFSVFKEEGHIKASSMHYMTGKPKDIESFIKDIKKDKTLIKLERKGNMFLLLENVEGDPVAFFNPKLIFVKPVFVDTDGYEYWELGSWDKNEVDKFVKGIKRTIKDSKLLKFTRENIDTVFFPRLMPKLTEKQRAAFDLAVSEGYYKFPRKTNLKKLAKISKISSATFQQRLRVAENKILLINYYYYK